MERMTPDTDKREGLGEGIYAKFVQNYEKLLEENKKLKEENEKLNLHIEAKDEAYMKLLKDYEELKNCGRYVFDCNKYDFTWLTSTTPQLEVSKKSDSGDVFTK